MAKLTLFINGDNTDALLKIKSVDQAAKKLNDTVIHVNVDASGLDAILEKSDKVIKAQADLVREENRLKVEREKTKQATEARKQAEANLAREQEKTAAATKKTVAAVQEYAQATQKTTQAIQQTDSAVKKVTVSAENLIQKVLMLPAHTEEAVSKVIALTEGISQQFVTLASNEEYARIEAEKLLPIYERLAQAARNATALTTVPGSEYSGYSTEGWYSSYWNGGTRNPNWWDMIYAAYQRQNPQLGSGINWTYGGQPENDPNIIYSDAFTVMEDGANRATSAFNTMREGMSAAWDKMQEGSKLAEIMRDSLGNIVVKMAAWQVMGNVVGTVIRSLREGVATLKEVDQELINIQKVSDLTSSQIKKIGDSAYETASKYGVSAQEYLEAVYTFQKAGIGENSEKMAELATKTMLVGDTTAEVATRFLIAANAAWKFGGDVEELSKIVDEADYINNNYATTLSDIATGLPIVGATAAQVGMSAEQTMAAIGTIVASTGQTASKAATALRAIIMNMIGETGELDDGTKVTAESIESLNDVLNKYAHDALAAAEAEGKILDPLEAIAALAKAAEDPLVKETELFSILAGLGGKLRTTQLTALVNNLDMANSMLEGMADSAGTADREISIMLESWNAKTQILKNTVTQFISHLVDSNAVKGGIDFLTSMVKLLDSGIGKVAALTVAFLTMGKAIAAIGASNVFHFITAEIAGLAAGTVTATTAVADLWALLSTNPLFWAAAAAGGLYALHKIIDAVDVTYEEQLEILNDLQKKYDELYGSGSEYDSLSGRVSELTQKEKERLAVLEAEAAVLHQQVLDQKLLTFESWRRTQIGSSTSMSSGSQYAFSLSTYDLTAENASSAGRELTLLNEQLRNGAITVEEYKAGLQSLAITLKDNAEAIRSGEEAGAELTESEIQLITVYNNVVTALSNLIDKKKQDADITKDVVETEKTAVGIYSEMKDKLGPLSDAMAQLTAQGYMDEAAMKALIAAYPDLEDAITATSDGFIISKEAIMENVLALWAEYSAINNNAAAASMVQILALNNENGAWAANTAEIKKNIAARIAALEAEQLSTHLIGNGYSGTYYGESVGLTGAEANELSMLKGLLKSIDSYGATTTTAGGSSGGGGGSKSTTDAKLDALKSIVSLRKQELSYLEASGATTDEQVAKMREIQSALHDQAEYMRSIGADEEDILKLSTEWWTYQNKITKELKESALALLEVQKEAALGPMQAQLELLKAQKDSVSEQREEEEKLLAVEKARIALENAQNERNVRQYNAKSGQWEWVANAEAVSKAQETLASAEQALSEYYDKKNRERQIAALEASIKDTEATYESLKTAVESNAVLEKMKENSAAWWNADSIVRKALEDQNLALGQSQGWHRINGTWYDAYGNQVYDSGGILRGIGGIKATRDDEMILPPRTTAALLNAEQTGAFDAVIRKLGIVMSAGQAFAGFGGGLAASSIGSQHNGDVYQIGGVTLTEQQARCMTVFDLAQMARNLSLHSA